MAGCRDIRYIAGLLDIGALARPLDYLVGGIEIVAIGCDYLGLAGCEHHC